jgi:hypothetical protein
VRKLHSQVTQFSAGRQPHAVIDCERLTVEQACHAVEAALRPARATNRAHATRPVGQQRLVTGTRQLLHARLPSPLGVTELVIWMASGSER